MRLESDTQHLITGPVHFLLNGFISKIQFFRCNGLIQSLSPAFLIQIINWVRVVIVRYRSQFSFPQFSMKMSLLKPVGSSPHLDMAQIVRSYQGRLQKNWCFVPYTWKIYISQNNPYENKFLRGVMNILALSNCKTGTFRRATVTLCQKIQLKDFLVCGNRMSSRSKQQSNIEDHF